MQKIVLFLGASLLAGMLASCSAAPAEPRREAGSSSIEPGHWPRTLSDATGTTVQLQSKPARVVSTSVTATGSLLALGAEVVASSTAAPTAHATADGFLTQWADIASERDVRPLPEYGKFDLEDIADQKPDLIVVAASGADSEMEHLPELRKIAATVVVDPAGEHWMEVSQLLAEATGTEPAAQRNSAEFSQRAAQLKDSLQVPAGTTASLVAGSGQGLLGMAKEDGPHAQLFSDLGFQVAGAPRKFDTSTLERQDFSFIRATDLPAAASGEALFLLSADESQAASFSTSEPAGQLPAVQAGNLFALDVPFVLDFYSAQQVLDYFEHDFPGLAAQDR